MSKTYEDFDPAFSHPYFSYNFLIYNCKLLRVHFTSNGISQVSRQTQKLLLHKFVPVTLTIGNQIRAESHVQNNASSKPIIFNRCSQKTVSCFTKICFAQQDVKSVTDFHVKYHCHRGEALFLNDKKN